MLAAATLAAVVAVQGSSASISTEASRLVSSDRPDAQFVETTVAANPRVSGNLVAAAMMLRGTATSVVVYATQDDRTGRFHAVFISGQDPAAMQLYTAAFDVQDGARR